MTYARELSLAETAEGLKLAFAPVTPAFGLRPASPSRPEGQDAPPRSEAPLPGEVFHARVEAPGPFTLTLSNDRGEALRVSLSNEQSLVVDRSRAGIRRLTPFFESGMGSVMSARRGVRGPVVLDLFFDRMIAEVFADGGTFLNTSLVFPERPYQRAVLQGEGKLWVGGVA